MCCPTSVARVSTPFRSRIPIRGPMARVGTGDDTGQSITYYEYPSSLAGPANRDQDVHQQRRRGSRVSRPSKSRSRNGLSQGWQLGASYSSTWVDTAVGCNAAGTGLGINNSDRFAIPYRCDTNPNQAFNTANNTREWQFKVSGAYNLPCGHPGVGELRYPEWGCPRLGKCSLEGARTIPSRSR